MLPAASCTTLKLGIMPTFVAHIWPVVKIYSRCAVLSISFSNENMLRNLSKCTARKTGKSLPLTSLSIYLRVWLGSIWTAWKQLWFLLQYRYAQHEWNFLYVAYLYKKQQFADWLFSSHHCIMISGHANGLVTLCEGHMNGELPAQMQAVQTFDVFSVVSWNNQYH